MSASSEILPPPHLLTVRGEDTLARGRGGWGVNILEDARHCSVLCISKYFVVRAIPCCPALLLIPTDTQYAYSTIPERGSRYTGTPDKQGEGLREVLEQEIGKTGKARQQMQEQDVSKVKEG
jgi:hypothetical protein